MTLGAFSNSSRTETLALSRTRHRLDVRLARPSVRNAFDDTMIADLTAVLEEAALDPELRCVVLGGEGPVFCAGADLQWMQRAAGFSTEENLEDARRLARLFALLDGLPCPTVASVRGAALGGGGGLVACADIALAAATTKLGFTEVRLGIVPAVISPFVVRRIGPAAARRYFTTGEIFDGRRAEAIGLVSEAVPDAELDERVEALVSQILSVGPRAAREAKRLIGLAAPAFPSGLHEETAALIARLRATSEAREGMAAFLAKRKPAWNKEPA